MSDDKIQGDMRKLLSEVIGMPIFEESMPERPVSLVRDVIVDPNTGAIVAFSCMSKKIVVPRDVTFFSNILFIRSREDLLDPNEVIRVREISRTIPTLLGMPVYIETKNNFLGRVTDLEFNVSTCALMAVYTSKIFLFLRYDSRIISSKNILEIKPEGIFVKNTAKVKTPLGVPATPEMEVQTPSAA